MKVQVDYDLCESNALCEAISPANFEIDDDDVMHVIDPEVTEENRRRIDQAIAACPKSALSLVED